MCTPSLVQDAVKLGPHGPWLGIVFSTLTSEFEAEMFKTLFSSLLPGDAMVTIHGGHSQFEVLRWLPKPSAFYKQKISHAVHS